MAKIKYINTNGKTIDLTNEYIHCLLKESGFHDFEWEPNVTPMTVGSELESTDIEPKEMDVVIIFSGSVKKREDNLRTFHDVTMIDTRRARCGKLFYDGSYMEGIFISSELDETEKPFTTRKNLVFYAPRPFWTTVEKITFNRFDAAQSSIKHTYPFRYPYRYGKMQRGKKMFNNTSSGESDFTLTINGPCVNPTLTINGHTYQIKTTLGDNEYAVIDSRTNRITKVNRYGDVTNIFNQRLKTSSIFKQIPTGISELAWNGSFSAELEIYSERSEAPWS